MQQNREWKEPVQQAPRRRSELHLTIDLGPSSPGAPCPLRGALQTIFPRGFTRKEAKLFVKQAVEAVSKAVKEDGCAALPLRVFMIRGDALNVQRITAPHGNGVIVEFPRVGQAA